MKGNTVYFCKCGGEIDERYPYGDLSCDKCHERYKSVKGKSITKIHISNCRCGKNPDQHYSYTQTEEGHTKTYSIRCNCGMQTKEFDLLKEAVLVWNFKGK